MILLAGIAGNSDPTKTETIWRLLARQHPARGEGEAGQVVAADGIVIGAAGENAIIASRDGRFLLAADARLDGRASLRATLDRPTDGSDAALILAAWESWGSATPQHLFGDYAFALWDAKARSLHLVRDALGGRPLHYRSDGSAFASRANAFDVMDGSHGRPSAEGLAAWLAFRTGETTTCYDGVARVLPGEMVVIEGTRVRRTRWWAPSLRSLPGRKPADAVAQCRALLDLAVADRLADLSGPVASHLSAGLDSGVVTALAARKMPTGSSVHAFTAVPGLDAGSAGRFADESGFAAMAAAAMPGVKHRSVTAQDDPLAFMLSAAEIYQQPLVNAFNHGWTAAINEAAQAAGARALLVGQFGNFTFSMAGDPRWRVRHLARTLLAPFRPRRQHPLPLAAPGVSALIDFHRHPAGGKAQRLFHLRLPDPGAFLKGTAAHWGLDCRDPFMDRRLAEFSLTLDDRLLARLGDRGLGRPVAAQLLPKAFVENPQRGYQSADWVDRLKRHAPAVRARIEWTRHHAILGELLDLDAVAAAADRLQADIAHGSADEALFQTDFPRALSVMAFVHSLLEPPSHAGSTAWRGTRL